MSSQTESPSLDFNKPDALVGKMLDGRFLIKQNLRDDGADEGGIGVVYLATDTKLMGKLVVVKILQEAALKHEDMVRKFLHEKEALIRLDHPGIVRILDSGTLHDGNPFMVMEFIEGHSLRKELRRTRRLPLVLAAHIIESVTDALAAAHSKNVVHRDIKPENIMLTPQEDGMARVRLIDFGIARVGESQLAPGTAISRAIGTILYIPPEQLIGSLDLTPAVDIYATGIVAYEMLTGELPFKPRAIAEMYQMEKEGVKVLPSELRRDLPRVAENVLMSSLEFDPEKRPQNARTFGRYLADELRRDEIETDKFQASIQTEYSQVPIEIMPTVDMPAHIAGEPEDGADEFQTVQRPPRPVDVSDKPGFVKWMAPVAGIAVLLLIAIGYLAWSVSTPSEQPAVVASTATNTAPEPQAEIFYFLTVQKMRDGKPFEEPFRSSGQEIFESGYKFNIVFQPQAAGYIYLFNEGKDKSGKTGYYLLFPTPSVNNGASQVDAGQEIQTAQNTFAGKKGTEILWMIWTKEQNGDLASITEATLAGSGTVEAENETKLQNILKKYETSKPESTKDSTNQRTVLKATGNTIVHRFELEHR